MIVKESAGAIKWDWMKTSAKKVGSFFFFPTRESCFKAEKVNFSYFRRISH